MHACVKAYAVLCNFLVRLGHRDGSTAPYLTICVQCKDESISLSVLAKNMDVKRVTFSHAQVQAR